MQKLIETLTEQDILSLQIGSSAASLSGPGWIFLLLNILLLVAIANTIKRIWVRVR